VRLEVDVLTPAMTELAMLVPGMERPTGTTLRYSAPDFPTAHRLVSLIAVLGRAA
jgi:D-amino peptidase